MPTITLSSKNQVTIPAEMVRRLGLKGGDKIVAELVDDHIVLLPQPASWVDYFSGRLKGVWGHTPEETDQHIADLRAGREPDEWRQEFDLIVEQPTAKRIVEYLRDQPSHAAAQSHLYDFRDKERIDANAFLSALEMLEEHGAVRQKKFKKVHQEGPFRGMEAVYYLVRELAKSR